uniref:Uncharacterized protein n=1 Tax=Amphimedon queenslandica TaxID=400682 RepID=A0A1X7TFQ4_AMPQE
MKSKLKTKRKVRKLTNDELFYDPNLDDEDEKWVEKQRRTYRNAKEKSFKKKGKSKDDSAPSTDAACTSDAVLNCPACMSTLSLDCQRPCTRTRLGVNYKISFQLQLQLLPKQLKPDQL